MCEALGGEGVGLGVWFGLLDVVGGDDGVEVLQEAGGLEDEVDVLSCGATGDGEG